MYVLLLLFPVDRDRDRDQLLSFLRPRLHDLLRRGTDQLVPRLLRLPLYGSGYPGERFGLFLTALREAARRLSEASELQLLERFEESEDGEW